MFQTSTRRRHPPRRQSLAFQALEPRAMLARGIAMVPTGVNPQRMAVTPDSRFAYVATIDTHGFAGEDSVTVINLRTNQAVTTIRDGSLAEPYTITINPRGALAWITDTKSSS